MSKELRALAEAATPGPWSVVTGNKHRQYNKIAIQPAKPVGFGLSVTSPVCSVHWYGDLGLSNADYIAACSPDVVLGLLDRLDRQDTLLRYAVAVMEHHTKQTRPITNTDEAIAAIEKEVKR